MKRWPVYAMDTCFMHACGRYPWDVRCAMLQELGYDGSYLTLFGEAEWALVPKLADYSSIVPVTAVYAMPAVDDRAYWRRVRTDLLPALPAGTACELAVQQGAENADVDAQHQRMLEEIAETAAVAEAYGVGLRLYPHCGFALDTTQACLDVVNAIKNTTLGVMFCSFHWYAGDPMSLSHVLAAADGRLQGVNLCGSRPGGPLYGYSIEPLDQGHCDLFLICAQLQRIDYGGSIGIQGYAQGGDPYLNLQRSLSTLRAIEDRLDAHPEWGEFDYAPTEHLATFRGPRGD